MDQPVSGGEEEAPDAGRKRSVSSLLRIKKKSVTKQDRDSDSTAASEASVEAQPKKKSGFLRKSKKVKPEDGDADPVKKISKTKSLVRKLSMSRSRKSSGRGTDCSSDDDRASNVSSTMTADSTTEGYATPSATTPPPPPLTPPPMEEDEDQSDGGQAVHVDEEGGGASKAGGGPREGSEAEPPVCAVTQPALEGAPETPDLSDDDMKGDKQPPLQQRAAAHGGAIKKTPKGTPKSSKGAAGTQSLVEEERKQTTREQLLSITTPAMQKQLNGKAAAAAVAATATAAAASSPSSPAPAEAGDCPPAGAAATPTDVVRVVAEVGGLAADGQSAEDTAKMSTTPPSPSSSPSSGDLMADARNKLSQSLGVTDPAQMSGEKREHLYKILVIGELGTGKTSIIKRYVHQFFSQHYRATIGVDFALKVLNWDPATIIRLQLWDIAGQERFGNMTRVYYKEAVGAFIVFDVTRASTFDAVVKWKQDLDSKVQMADGSPIPCVLLANKCDQQKEGIVNNPSKMDEYCKDKGFTSWFETSAKENVNIEDAARALVSKILLNDKLLHGNDTKDPTKIALDNNGKAGGDSSNRKSCAC